MEISLTNSIRFECPHVQEWFAKIQFVSIDVWKPVRCARHINRREKKS